MALELLAPKLANSVKHIMIDGAARQNTEFTLSHWPSSPTPPYLQRDLSFETVMAYLESIRRRRLFIGRTVYKSKIKYVTIDHLDEDGILSVFAILNPEVAFQNQSQLTRAAQLGDFNIASFSSADTLTFALRFLLDPKRTYLSYAENIDAFINKSFMSLCDLIEKFLLGQGVLLDEAEAETATFHRSYQSFISHTSEITEIPAISLAIVHIARFERMEGTSIKGDLDIGIHPAAVHTLTDMPRILLMYKDGIFYYDRYETWVRFVSKKLPRRVNLEIMAARLNTEEQDIVWCGDSPSEPIACFYQRSQGLSKLSPEKVKDFVCNYLEEHSLY